MTITPQHQKPLIAVAEEFLESVTFDDSGIGGRGGQGGLISTKTQKISGELRLAISRSKKQFDPAAKQLALSVQLTKALYESVTAVSAICEKLGVDKTKTTVELPVRDTDGVVWHARLLSEVLDEHLQLLTMAESAVPGALPL